jgi:hypothetical protein
MANLPSAIVNSFISNTPSSAAATVTGGMDEHAEEEQDYFFEAVDTFDPYLHRFSLAKPGWRLFSNKPTTAALSELKASRTLQASEAGQGAGQSFPCWTMSVDNLVAASKSKATDAAGMLSRCDFCEKRLGMLKTFMHCDECGYRTHIHCTLGTRSLYHTDLWQVPTLPLGLAWRTCRSSRSRCQTRSSRSRGCLSRGRLQQCRGSIHDRCNCCTCLLVHGFANTVEESDNVRQREQANFLKRAMARLRALAWSQIGLLRHVSAAACRGKRTHG